jgi:hypothetical protein
MVQPASPVLATSHPASRAAAGVLSDLAPELLGPGGDGSTTALPGDVISRHRATIVCNAIAYSLAQVAPEVAAERMRVPRLNHQPMPHSHFPAALDDA